MHHPFRAASVAIFTAFAVVTPTLPAAIIGLETPSLGGSLYEEDWNSTGGFTSGGAFFNNRTDPFGWAGFALSRMTDATTAGFGNQYSAYAGSGAGGSLQYAVAYYESFTPTIPTITLPDGEYPLSIEITNTTYAGISMRDGDAFSKKFGGASGNEPDFFKLTISGYNAANAFTGSVEFYLADFRAANNALDYIVQAWTTVDLSSLPTTTRSLQFAFASSDNGQFGMNTPAYVAVDNLTTVPEPGTTALLLGALAGLAARRRRNG